MQETLPPRSYPETTAEILAAGLDQLEGALPPGWTLERRESPAARSGRRTDSLITLKAPNHFSPSIVVEAYTAFAPRDVADVLGGRRDILKQATGGTPVLVIAPALSERVRLLLAEQGYGYADLAGNVRLLMDQPGLFIERVGTGPRRKTRQSHASLRGTSAGRVVRLLADVAPPYGVGDIARAASVTPGYVSKLFDYLDSEAIIERGRRGVVTNLDWRTLLTVRAQHYSVFEANRAQFFVSPQGVAAARERMRDHNHGGGCLTGSFLAAEFAPITTPALLALYVRGDRAELVEALQLLPGERGADVVLLTPYDDVVLERLRLRDLHDDAWMPRSTPAVSLTQAVLDGLTGNGRMPAEAEALMEWMANHEPLWRVRSLEHKGTWETRA